MSMIKVFSARDYLEANFVRRLLSREGIHSVVLGEMLQSVRGEVPAFAASSLPQVCVDSSQLEQAAALIQKLRSGEIRKELREQGAWECPRCHEKIEAQFTDCWNCGETREFAEDARTEDDEPLPREVWLDVPCSSCEYNLRTLSLTGKCPECGVGVARSLLAFVDKHAADAFPQADQLLRATFQTVGEKAGFPPDAVYFLRSAWADAASAVPPPPLEWKVGFDPQDAYARNLCRAIGKTALDLFGSADSASRAFRAWSITDCQQLGRSLFGLIDAGVIEAVPKVAVDDFLADPIESIFA